MLDVYKEKCFSQKIFTNELNMGLPLRINVKKIIKGVEIRWLSSKEKVPGAVVSKEGNTDSLLRHERIHCY